MPGLKQKNPLGEPGVFFLPRARRVCSLKQKNPLGEPGVLADQLTASRQDPAGLPCGPSGFKLHEKARSFLLKSRRLGDRPALFLALFGAFIEAHESMSVEDILSQYE